MNYPKNNSTFPKIGENSAVFEMAGMRYLLVGIGPAEGAVIEPRPAVPASVQETVVPVTTGDEPAEGKPRYVYGLRGIMQLFGCSKSTAYEIKRSGKLDGAISQIGNTIVVDADKALALCQRKAK